MINRDNESPDFTELTDLLIDVVKGQIRSTIPATIVTADVVTKRATVQISMKKIRGDGTAYAIPPIPDRRIAYPAGGGWSITWGLSPGDEVLLSCADRDIEDLLARGGVVAPKSGRKHSESDSIVLPFSYGKGAALAGNPTELTIGRDDGSAKITISLGGVVTIDGLTLKWGSAAVSSATKGTELNALIDSSLTAAIAAASGVVPPGDGGSAAFAAFKTAWDLGKTATLSGKTKVQ
jgi:hypothetical protein